MVSKIRERTADSVPSGTVNVWDLLRKELAAAPVERPENSITVEEFAFKAGYSYCHAGRMLRANPLLKPVRFKSPSGKMAIAYVPNDAPREAA